MSRLDAAAVVADTARGGEAAGKVPCLECGAPFAPKTPHGEFCSSRCRRAFNNRRAVRGAELYDLFMALRFERELATGLKLWKLLNRMAAGFRAEDVRRRGGRKSWRSARRVIERRPYLKADVILGPARRRK